MARVAVQFVASSNMAAAVTADIARINASLASLAAGMAAIPMAGSKGINQVANDFRNSVNQIQGYNSAQMQARTVTAQLTDDINRQRASMRDMSKLRANDGRLLGQLAQEQLRFRGASIMETGRDIKGNVFGELITQTGRVGTELDQARMKAGLMGKAMESAGLQTMNAGKRMQWTGRQISAGITTPIVAVGAASAVAAYQIDAEMTRLAKVYGDLSGVAEGELEQVKEATTQTAKDIAASYGIAAKETTALAADFAAAGFRGVELQEAVRETQRIATLGELDRQKAMQATISIQTVYGHSADELSTKFDFLNAVEGQTNTTLKDLTEAIPRTAGIIRDLGGSIEESAIYTVAFKEAGIEAVQGANALRSSLGAIVAPSGVAQKKLNALGIDIRRIAEENSIENGGSLMGMLQALGTELDGLTSTSRQEALATLFGRYQFNKMNGLLKALTQDINDTSTQTGRAFELMGASAEELRAVADRELAAIQESLSGRLRRAAQSIVATFAELGRPILHFVVIVAEAFAGIASFFNKFPGIIKGTIVAFLGLVALAGPLIFFAGVFKAMFGFFLRLVGMQKAARNGVTELSTANSTFSRLAQNSVIPTINAQAGAATALARAMDAAALAVGRLATANAAAMGANAASAAAAARTTPIPATTGRLAAGSPGGTGGQFAPIVPAGPLRGAAGLGMARPADVAAARAAAQATKDAAEKSARVRANWQGATSSIALAGTLITTMSGATGKLAMILQGIFLTLMIFPQIITGIGTALAALSAKVGLAAVLLRVKAALLGVTAGATAAGGAMKVLRAISTAMWGPIGAIIVGITLLIGAFALWKKRLKEAAEEQKALNGAAESMAGIVGFEYTDAAARAKKANEEQTETLHDQAKAWKETGEAAKAAAKAIEEADNPDQAGNMAKAIVADARANGATKDEARRAGEIALAAGGYNEVDAREIVNGFIDDVSSQAEAQKYQLETIGRSLVDSMTKGGTKEATANQNLKDYGEKFAARLIPEDLQQNIKELEILREEMNNATAEALKDVEIDDSRTTEMLLRFNINPKDKEAVGRFFAVEWPNLTEGAKRRALDLRDTEMLPSDIVDIQHQTEDFAASEATLVEGLKEAAHMTSEAYREVDTLAEFRQALVGNTISLAAAEDYYRTTVKEAEAEQRAMGAATWELTEAEKLAILNTARAAAGLDEATRSSQGFRKSTAGAASEVDYLAAAMEEGKQAATAWTSSLRGKIEGNVSDAIAEMMDSFDADTEKIKEGFEDADEIFENGWERRKKASDEAFEAEQDAMEKTLDAEEKAMDKRHEKTLDDAEKQKDARVKAIENEIDKAEKLDEQRKKMFDAEMTRIQRLQQAANRNIDFNIALDTGNLDEAARISEASYVDSVANSQADATSNLDSVSEQRKAQGEARINRVTTAEDARISGIRSTIDAEKEAFDARRKMAQDELQDAKDAANERFETEREAFRKTAEAAKKSYDDARAAKRKQTEDSLKQTAIEVPTTAAEYDKLFKDLQADYKANTGVTFTETKAWTNLHMNGLKTAFENTRKELGNADAWAALGEDTINAMTQGMLGMSFADFDTWFRTGKMPEAKPVLRPATQTNGDVRVAGGTIPMRHSGGTVDSSMGSRAGRPMNAPLYPDEVPTILQKGEFVVQKKAVDSIGVNNLQSLNQGKADHTFYHEGGLVGTIGMAIMGKARDTFRTILEASAARKAQEIAATGDYTNIPQALLPNVATFPMGMDVAGPEAAKAILAALREHESGSNYKAQSKISSASGAYQYIDGTWNNYGGYKRAFMAPPAVQDARAMSDLMAAYSKFQDWKKTLVNHFYPAWANRPEMWNRSPAPGNPTVNEYVDSIMSKAGIAAMAALPAGIGPAATPGQDGFAGHLTAMQRQVRPDVLARVWSGLARVPGRQEIVSGLRPGSIVAGTNRPSLHGSGRAVDIGARANDPRGGGNPASEAIGDQIAAVFRSGLIPGVSEVLWKTMQGGNHYDHVHVGFRHGGGLIDSIPGLKVGGTVNYDNTIANLHKGETVLTAPLSSKLENGINQLDSGTVNHYNITVNGTGADAEAVANKVMNKIQRMEQIKGPRRVIK